ncbi:DUF6907 domain-containing protein [Micromonospora sp. CA-263727]|uniref:DUF6907 domain-containing protein n=1 Tax=Micromonospora sp. CA-263727 TaxID=3239967 RepID=UPI003D92CC81
MALAGTDNPVAGLSQIPAPTPVFRPFWMVGTEPSWCVFGHFDDDKLDERRHESAAVQMRLSLADAHDHGAKIPVERRYEAARLHVKLVQRPAEVEPALRFFRDRWAEETWFTCTVAEASDLANKLVSAAERGEEPLPIAPPAAGSPFWSTASCPSWCQATHDVDGFYEDRVHMPDLCEDAMVRVDLHLERATADRPEWLELMVFRHYRESIGTIDITKSQMAGITLTPAEARTLAGELRRLIHDSQAAPLLPKAPDTAVTPAHHPVPLRYERGTAHYPCPHRITWCDGHSKREILDARTPGNMLLHSMVIDRVPGEGCSDSYVKVALEHDDDPNHAPSVYLTTKGDGTDLNGRGVDRLIAALRHARAAIVGSNVDPTPADLPTAAATRTASVATVDWQRHAAQQSPNAA